MRWRKNWAKYQRRRAIRAEYARRMDAAPRTKGDRTYGDALAGYLEVTAKIRRFYSAAPIDAWWPILKTNLKGRKT